MDDLSLSALKSRLDAARLLAARLQGARDADARQLKELTDKVSEAKARLSLAEEVSRILEAMQTRAHSRSVGTFEQLLTAVLQDVLPEKGGIRLELSNSNNSPNLDIFVDNDGSLEDVLDGSGGAVTNVVSAGLRFAALTRTKNRRLMVLDEPDCWIKPSRVPNFIRVIADVARETKTQTLLISHHDPAYFRGRTNLLELTRSESGQVVATVCDPVVTDWESESQPGIRSIQLINFRAHKDTTLKLFPGVTALIGDNDLGKSTALVASLKAVGYNESDDTVIRHGAKEAQIVIELENDRWLVWTRKAKGSPKVTYALYAGSELIAEGKAPGRGSVPDWVQAELGISEVDDLDIQIGSQKNPVFLLDQPASRRATLLSVGREAGHLVKVMEAWGDIKRVDRETVKDGETRISRLTYRQARMAPLDAAVPECLALLERFTEVDAFAQKFAGLVKLTQTLATVGADVLRLNRETQALGQLPTDMPVLNDVLGLQDVTARIAKGLPYKAVELPAMQVQAPDLQDTAVLARIGTKISQLQKYRPLFDVRLPEMPEQPSLSDERHLQSTAIRLNTLLTNVGQSRTDQVQANTDYGQGVADYRALQDSMGGVCPLCDHKFEEGHSHANVE